MYDPGKQVTPQFISSEKVCHAGTLQAVRSHLLNTFGIRNDQIRKDRGSNNNSQNDQADNCRLVLFIAPPELCQLSVFSALTHDPYLHSDILP